MLSQGVKREDISIYKLLYQCLYEVSLSPVAQFFNYDIRDFNFQWKLLLHLFVNMIKIDKLLLRVAASSE